MKCIILAGGFGTRLKEVVSDVPKPMAPINGVPFLSLLIDHLAKQGITHVVLATHYMHQTIEGFLGLGHAGIPITYAFEDKPLYAGGAIVNAIHEAKIAEPVIVVNGDTFVKVNYRALYHQHLETKADVTMVLRHVANAAGKGIVDIAPNGRMARFGAMGEAGKESLINAGVWVLNPSVLAEYQRGQPFSFEKDFLQPRVPHLIQPHTFVVDDYFIDFGTPAEYARAQVELAAAMRV